jgi:hypothetical protein
VIWLGLGGHEALWLAGKPIDAAQYTTLTNLFRRLLETVGLKRVARDVTPSLEQYLASEAKPRTEKPS